MARGILGPAGRGEPRPGFSPLFLHTGLWGPSPKPPERRRGRRKKEH